MELLVSLKEAIAARREIIGEDRSGALRLFNGFLEGFPDLVIDLFAGTLILNSYAAAPETAREHAAEALRFLRQEIPWAHTSILKFRRSPRPSDRRGILLHGDRPDQKIREFGVWYAINPLLNQDNSFYPDTRLLRRWALDNLAGKTVLNTFAYTGSLGVAARAGGARRVVHLDLNRSFLDLAKRSCSLNGFPVQKSDFLAQDFFTAVGRFKHSRECFDCVILDPPFFSKTIRGQVDLLRENSRLINKVRPLLNHGGYLAVINNALFLSGEEFMHTLETLCADGYMRLLEIISIPPDCAGYPQTIRRSLPVDPAPFNHATKIVILQVRRKGEGDFPPLPAPA